MVWYCRTMPRKVVPLETGERYHVFNRGVDKRVVFHDTEDYVRFYESLHLFNTKDPVISIRAARRQDYTDVESLVTIEAYALLNNHLHLVVRQDVEGGLAEFMKRVAAGYTCYYNEKYERSGVLFQGTYKRVHLQTDAQCNYVTAYVHENYIVHGLSEPQHLYQSSSLHMCRLRKSKLLRATDGTSDMMYDQQEVRKLAKDIWAERQIRKSELLE